MKKRGWKLCSLVLSTAMAATCLPAGTVKVRAAEEEGAAAGEENGIVKTTEAVIQDDFTGDLDPAWFDMAGNVEYTEGTLTLNNDGGPVSSIKRNVGNGDFTVETKWSSYSADTQGNNSVVIFRVSDGTENNLVEIQRFSNGELKLLLINDKVQTSYTTKTDFADTEGWFQIGYNSDDGTVIAVYRTGDEDEYIPLEGNGEAMSNFGGKHVAELRAQKWGGSAPVSVDFLQFNSTFVKEAQYSTAENTDFTGPVLTDDWYGQDGDVRYEDGHLALVNAGDGISTVKRNAGDQDYSIEAKWSGFSSDETGGAILRTSLDSSEENFAQMMRMGDGTLRFTVVNQGETTEKIIPYEESQGWFRIDYDSQAQTIDAYYKVNDEDMYVLAPGSGMPVSDFTGIHTAELIADDWDAQGETSIVFDEVDFAYNEEVNLKLQSDYFTVDIDEETGGIFKLSNPGDEYGTNYVMNPTIKPEFDVDDSRWTGDVKLTVKKGDSDYYPALTSWSDDTRKVSRRDDAVTVSYESPSAGKYGIKDFALRETYRLNEEGNQLNWSINIQNTADETIEIADLGLPLLMNSWWNTSQEGIYEQNVARHSYVAEDGSYIYWQRPNGDGSFLVMVPDDGTSLEFKDKARFKEGPFAEKDPSWEGLVEYYIHSKEISKDRPGGYLPATSLSLEPEAEQTYGFTFYWASDYSDLRDILYEAGIVDAVSLPGMVIPQDMKATLAVRCKEQINSVTADSDSTEITKKEDRNGYEIYEIAFSDLGENYVTVNYGEDKKSVLQYYATEPIETLIQSNTDFLVDKQQAKTEKGYNGAYLQWDMSTGKQISWDDYPGGGWKEWMAGGSDDLGLSPAVYLSEKNITAPQQDQIDSLEYYMENFIWGYMQQHDTYKVYRWYDGKDGTPKDQGTWRSYNYVHVANTYYNMYQIALRYPDMTHYLSADDYLLRCYNTLKAYFTYGMFDGHNYENGGRGAYIFGNMGEMNLPNILNALEQNGHSEEQAWLAGKVEEKADILFAEAYPFASEMSIDTTGFEACYTLAKMYGNGALTDKVTLASLACRGMQPLWYYYGSDNRHMGESWWNLGYETQLGAWQQQDYLYTYADTSDQEFDDIMRGTYGAYLAGWANINSGQISDSDVNYGAASWQYQSEKGTNGYNYIPSLDGWWAWSGEASLGFWGGLKTASANIVDDDIVGLYGYGCDLDYADGIYSIVPKDGVRTRLTLYNKDKFAVQLDKARYTKAGIADDLSSIALTLENVTEKEYAPEITISRLPAGEYEVVADKKVIQSFSSDGTEAVFTLELSADKKQDILIQTKQSAEPADKTNLETAVNLAKETAAQTEKYTEKSLADLNNAIREAEAVLGADSADQKEVDQAAQKLAAAMDALVNVEILRNCVTRMENLSEEDYTKESFKTFSEARKAAADVLEKADASQEEVDQSYEALVKAWGKLEHGVNTAAAKVAAREAQAILDQDVSVYRPAGIKKLKEALRLLNGVLSDETSTQEDVNRATETLITALTELKDMVDASRLQNITDLARELMQEADKYTEASQTALQTAIDTAAAVLENEDRTRAQVSQAYEAVAEAIGNMQVRGNKAALESAVQMAEDILKNAGSYTDTSLAGLQEALDSARQVLDNGDALQQEINDAAAMLTESLTKVRLLGDVNHDGKINTSDAASVLRASAELTEIAEEDLKAADVNKDQAVNTADAALIEKYAAELITSF